MPDNLASAVLGVTGLDTTQNLMKPVAIAPPPSFVNARPCSISYGEVTPSQADFKTPLPKFQGKYLRTRRAATPGAVPRRLRRDTAADGSGLTVAIIDASVARRSQQGRETYATKHGDAAYATGPAHSGVPTPSPTRTAYGCDAAAGPARRPSTSRPCTPWPRREGSRYYGARAATTTTARHADPGRRREQGVDRHQLVGRGRAGRDHQSIAAYEQVFLQGAVQGISFMFSSGDNGDELANTGLKQADYPASDPYVTAVGGTATRSTPARQFSFQTGWGTQKYSLSRGRQVLGPDRLPVRRRRRLLAACSTSPAYQQGVVPGTLRQRPRRARRGHGRRPDDRHAGRSDPDLPRGCTTASTGSAAPAWPRRCSRGCRRCPAEPGTRLGLREPDDLQGAGTRVHRR